MTDRADPAVYRVDNPGMFVSVHKLPPVAPGISSQNPCRRPALSLVSSNFAPQVHSVLRVADPKSIALDTNAADTEMAVPQFRQGREKVFIVAPPLGRRMLAVSR